MPPEVKRYESRAYVRSLNIETHSLEAYVSTAALASDGMIILPRAWAEGMPLFMANPVIPWQHDYDRGPVAKAEGWRIDPVGLILAPITFDTKKPLGIETWNSYEGGFLRAFSVGFSIDRRTSSMKPKQILDEYGSELPDFVKLDLEAIIAGDRDVPGGFWGMRPDGIEVVTKATLLEASCVTVPADRYALVRAQNDKARHFVDGLYRDERPGWEDTTPDDAKAGQIRYRLKDQSLFDADSFVTLSLDVKSEGDVQKIRGKLKDGDDELHDQAVHFNKSAGWTMDAAKEWWKEHEGDGQEKGLTFTVVDELTPALVRAGEKMAEFGVRIGKVLSAKNKTIIENAVKQTKEATAALEAVLAAAEGGDGDESHGAESDADRVADVELRQRVKRIYAGG